MNFSTANLALVAYATVKADGTMLKSSGFVQTVAHVGSTGYYVLTLVDELAQEPTDGVYPDVLVAGTAGNSIAVVTPYHADSKQVAVNMIDMSAVALDANFNLLVLRPVIPPLSATP